MERKWRVLKALPPIGEGPSICMIVFEVVTVHAELLAALRRYMQQSRTGYSITSSARRFAEREIMEYPAGITQT
jgi:hypothetical protein